MSDPQPFLTEALAIREAIDDLYDRTEVLLSGVVRQGSTSFLRGCLETTQNELSDAQKWLRHADAAVRSLHRSWP